MAVRKEEPELSNGTERGKSKSMQMKLMLGKTTIGEMDIMGMCKMIVSIMGISGKSSSSYLLRREDMDTNIFKLFWFVFYLSLHIPLSVGQSLHFGINHPQ